VHSQFSVAMTNRGLLFSRKHVKLDIDLIVYVLKRLNIAVDIPLSHSIKKDTLKLICNEIGWSSSRERNTRCVASFLRRNWSLLKKESSKATSKFVLRSVSDFDDVESVRSTVSEETVRIQEIGSCSEINTSDAVCSQVDLSQTQSTNEQSDLSRQILPVTHESDGNTVPSFFCAQPNCVEEIEESYSKSWHCQTKIFETYVEPKDMELMFDEGLRKLKPSYINTLRTLFNTYNIPCIYNAKNKNVGKKFIKLYGYCPFRNCRKFIIDINPKIRKLIIRSSASIFSKHHLTEKMTAYLNRNKREEMKDMLLYKSCRSVKAELVNSVRDDLVSSGNLQNIKSDSVLRKVRVEVLSKHDMHKDPLISLYEMYKSQNIANKYIQFISMPFQAFMFSNEQVSVVKKALKSINKGLTLHIDATGSCVKAPSICESSTTYYYAGVVSIRSASCGKTEILPVLECISTTHSAWDIGRWLSFYLKIIGELQFKKMFRIIVTDWSLALINGVCREINRTTLTGYLETCYQYVNDGIDTNKFKNNNVSLTLCFSHFIKIIMNDLNKVFSVKKQGKNMKDQKDLIKNVIRILSEEICYKNIKMISHHFFTILLSDEQNDKFLESYNFMTTLIYSITNETDIWSDSSTEGQIGTNECHTLQSPFVRDFEDMKASIISSLGITVGNEKNVHYCPDFVDVFITKYAPVIPMWTGVITGEKETQNNGTVEKWFDVIKHNFLDNQTHLRVDRFVNKSHMAVKSICKSLLLDIPSERLTKKDKSHKNTSSHTSSVNNTDMDEEETWRRKSPKSGSKKVINKKISPNINKNVFEKNKNGLCNILYYTSINIKKLCIKNFMIARDSQTVIQSLYYNDFITLQYNCSDTRAMWLSDAVIDVAASCLKRKHGKEVTILPSFLGGEIANGNFALASSIVNDKYNNNDYIIPINTGDHWQVLIVDINSKSGYLLDSAGNKSSIMAQGEKYIANIGLFFENHYKNHFKTTHAKEWRHVYKECAKQKDSYNCGVHVLQYIENVFLQKSLTLLREPNEHRKYLMDTILKYAEKIETYCPTCAASYNGRKSMVECTFCNRWFHQTKECIGRKSFKIRHNFDKIDWMCYICEAVE